MKTRAILQTSPELFMAFMIAFTDGPQARAFRVVEHGLPTDTQIVRVFYDAAIDELCFLLESEHFAIAPDARVHSSGYAYLDKPMLRVEYSA